MSFTPRPEDDSEPVSTMDSILAMSRLKAPEVGRAKWALEGENDGLEETVGIDPAVWGLEKNHSSNNLSFIK